MNRDLKIIKKKYGEVMMHYCRSTFPVILEEEGLLSRIIMNNFHECYSLYDDLVSSKMIENFKNFIYQEYFKLRNNDDDEVIDIYKTPEELMEMAGYDLYECMSEEDIQSFRKYYAKGEELCTFWGDRLNSSRVFFAVKKNVDEIKRENFKKPRRQDGYGTSVISIQFTKDDTHTLSIKNRYNHKVEDCDSTFSNDLDNIIAGLTDAFANTYGLKQGYSNTGLEIAGYVRASDGKYYKYNYEINNIYYCVDNIIIDNFVVKKYDKSKYLILDYYILRLDRENRDIELYDKSIVDSFPSILKNIKKIDIENIDKGKRIIIDTVEYGVIKIVVDRDNRIINLDLGNIKKIGNAFLFYVKYIKSVDAEELEIIGNAFLYSALLLNEFNGPCVNYMGKWCFYNTSLLEEFRAESLKGMGGSCFYKSKLKKFTAPKLEICGNNCFYEALSLEEFYAPSLIELGAGCFYNTGLLKKIVVADGAIYGEDCFANNIEMLNKIFRENQEYLNDGSESISRR